MLSRNKIIFIMPNYTVFIAEQGWRAQLAPTDLRRILGIH
jgi:hypothetical protein